MNLPANICPECGARRKTWGPREIIGAIQDWHAKHGEAPRAYDWRRASPEHPVDGAVRTVFGSFSAGIKAAGLIPRPNYRPISWTRERIIQAIFEYRYEHGRLPRWRDWKERTDNRYPHVSTVHRVFGGWNAALEAAGYEPNLHGRRTREEVAA